MIGWLVLVVVGLREGMVQGSRSYTLDTVKDWPNYCLEVIDTKPQAPSWPALNGAPFPLDLQACHHLTLTFLPHYFGFLFLHNPFLTSPFTLAHLLLFHPTLSLATCRFLTLLRPQPSDLSSINGAPPSRWSASLCR